MIKADVRTRNYAIAIMIGGGDKIVLPRDKTECGSQYREVRLSDHAVIIVVRVTGVSEAILVSIELIRVRRGRTVIDGIVDPICIEVACPCDS